MDVTVLIPDETGIRAFPDEIYFDAEGLRSRPGLALRKDDPADSDIHSYGANRCGGRHGLPTADT